MKYQWKYTNLSENYTIFVIIYIYKSYDKLIMTDQITNKLSWSYVLSHILYTLSSLIFDKGKYIYTKSFLRKYRCFREWKQDIDNA